MYVACQAECEDRQIDLFGRNPPLIALCEEPEQTPNDALGVATREPEGGGGGEYPLRVETRMRR